MVGRLLGRALGVNNLNNRSSLNGNNNDLHNNNGSVGGMTQQPVFGYCGIMKTYRNLFSQLCSLENLERAYKKARKGKTQKQYVLEFEQKLKENLDGLQRELTSKTYHPQPLKTFILRDPKTRKISVSDFRDRVVHHAICNILEPILEQRFIYDSYANRKRKGVLAALKRFDQFKQQASKSNIRACHVLKADIKHYFDTVDHEKLLGIISKKIKDMAICDLIRKIITNHRGKQTSKGMPLGNLTSQFFANVYLNEFDQFIKHKLKVRHYIRYVDDFIIFHYSAEQLKAWKKAISIFLKQELLLELHPQKSRIRPLSKGIDFVGFRCFYHFRLLRQRNIRKMRRKLERQSGLYKKQKITAVEILKSFQGWNAYAMHANTYTLRRIMTNKFLAIIQH